MQRKVAGIKRLEHQHEWIPVWPRADCFSWCVIMSVVICREIASSPSLVDHGFSNKMLDRRPFLT